MPATVLWKTQYSEIDSTVKGQEEFGAVELRELGLERSPGGGNGNPLQYSCLENSMAGYHLWGHKELYVTEQLSLSPLISNVMTVSGEQ